MNHSAPSRIKGAKFSSLKASPSLRVLHRHVDAFVAQFLHHVGIAGHDGAMEARLVVLELAADLLANDRYFADVARIHLGEKL